MSRDPFTVKALWDRDAEVWVAVSDDVPGLCAEAATLEELIDVVIGLIPDLVELNGIATGGASTLPLHVVAEQNAMVRLHG